MHRPNKVGVVAYVLADEEASLLRGLQVMDDDVCQGSQSFVARTRQASRPPA